MIKVLRKIAAVILVLLYVGIVLVGGNVLIWKIARNYYINPLEVSIGFTIIALIAFGWYFILVVGPVLPDIEDKGDKDK